MPNQQHHPKITQRFLSGANRDAGKELLGEQEAGEGARGQYIDSRNQRIFSDDGKNFYSKKIGGETEFFDDTDNRCIDGDYDSIGGDWECVGSIPVKGYIVEFWVDKDGSESPVIRVDGLIVAQNSSLPFTENKPLQLDKNESCVGGEVFINTRNDPVIILNVEDMLKNSGRLDGNCTDKYFDGFELNSFTTNLEVSPDIMVFRKLIDVGSGQGLPVGQYAYKLRYFDEDGNKTQMSIPTPLIPVVKDSSSKSDEFPYVKTKGGASGSNTDFEIQLKFRITNQFNYKGVEIVRIAFNAATALGFLPEPQLIYTIDDLESEEVNVITFTDGANRTATDLQGTSRGATEADVPITDEEDTDVLESVDSAGAMRYFDNRLILGNIQTSSRDTEDSLTFKEVNDKKMFPVIRKMGQVGHNDPYNSTYFKSYMTGERYGLSVIPIDSKFSRAFAVTPPGSDPNDNPYSNFKMPNRRTPTATETDTYSYLGSPTAAPEDGGSATNVHEVFDLTDAKRLTDKCTFKNILNDGGLNSNKARSKVTLSGCPEPPGSGRVEADEVGYKPYYPVNPDSEDVDGHNFRSVLQVYKTNGGSAVDYQPKGYGPNYYSQGIALSGITSYPSWVKAFAVARTEPAKRVIAQGLGFYSLRSAGNNNSVNSKLRDRFYLYAPDIDTQIGLSPDIASDMESNPSDYEIELVSPLGFFSDIFSGEFITGPGAWRGIDMITYARILFEDGSINTGDGTGSVGKSGYVSYDKWRNTTGVSRFSGGDALSNGELKRFGLNSVSGKTTANGLSSGATGRGNFLEIRTNQNIYNKKSSVSSDFDDSNVKEWHEPVYMINIIKNGASVKDSNVKSFIPTGAYQKIESVIGSSDGTDEQDMELIDERWEDCINGLDSFMDDAFIYIEGPDATEDKAWIDITFKSTSQKNTIINDIINDGFHTTGGKNVYGVYTHTNVDNESRFFEINFSVSEPSFAANTEVFIPEKDALVKVKYNSEKPIQVFGGDTYIGESIFCPVDMLGQNEHGTNPENNANDFRLSTGFPYRKWELNPRIYQINDTTGANSIQDRDDVDFINLSNSPYRTASIRQMAVMFTCEARLHLPYLYGTNNSRSFFPDVNYIMRPFRWDKDDSLDDNNIYENYSSDYPGEASVSGAAGRWRRGGIRFQPRSNIDYSQIDTSTPLFSKSATGFEENNEFCSRVQWTGRRVINNPDTGGLKSFPALNIFDIEDNSGSINFLWSAYGGNKGENLYAFTNRGVAILLADKRILSQTSGDELAIIGTDDSGFIQEEIWLSKEIGMPGNNWRTAASDNNVLWWADNESVYRLEGNRIEDIGRGRDYHSRLFPFLSNITGKVSDKLTGVYDERHNEYWMKMSVFPNVISLGTNLKASGFGGTKRRNISLGSLEGYTDNELSYIKLLNADVNIKTTSGSHTIKICNGSTEDFDIHVRDGDNNNTIAIIEPGECFKITGTTGSFSWDVESIDEKDEKTEKLFVFNENVVSGNQRGAWTGTHDYSFDRFVSVNNKVYGMRDFKTFELNKGTKINDEAIEYEMIQAFAPLQDVKKEFIRIGVNSNVKPTKITLHDDPDTAALSEMSEAQFGTNWLRNYDGFENFIPRDTVSRNRRQDRLLVYKIFHNLEEDFNLISTKIQFKQII